ncbi:MAG: family N-acetyltransferase [Paenibacillaceae bacterium]|jgi:ribosomal protein S18 acetylase RimI-like enzyme|nr:family N-acetyltransferase [Paenibacillaceae bacterium]
MLKLTLSTWQDNALEAAVALWNRTAVKDGYKEMTAGSFNRIFLQNPYFDPACTFLLTESDGGSAGSAPSSLSSVLGFACGVTGEDLPLGADAGYLTTLLLDEDIANDRHYSILLDAVEQRFRALGKTQAEALFFNPVKLPWLIPGTLGHEHNNAPGIPVDSALHRFLLEHGYAERARQNGMYLDLSAFAIPPDILEKEQQAEQLGYRVEWYDGKRYTGLAEMLTILGNPAWVKELAWCAEEGIPFLVAAHQGRTAGFAGPVIREPRGRGYFAGIGVNPEDEGKGLGSILFFRLCDAFRGIGTEYMSLFTGEANPALKIYHKAGFRTAKQFGVLRKVLKES